MSDQKIINIMISSRGRTMPALQDEETPKKNYDVVMTQNVINGNTLTKVMQELMKRDAKTANVWVLGEQPPLENFPLDLLMVMLSEFANENNKQGDLNNIHNVEMYVATKKDSDNLILVNVIPDAVDYGSAERVVRERGALYGV